MKKAIVFTGMLVFAAAVSAKGDPAAGKSKAAVCAGCHGQDGVSIAPMYPNLAGQKEQYLVNAITAYREKQRTGGNAPTMYPMVGSLSDQDVQDLAAYFSSLPAGGK
ncbi:cytochrome c [Arhodomonas sp. KWT2]